MNRKVTRIVIMLAIVAIAIVSAGAIIRARSNKSEKVEIKTAKVERADIKSTVSATGVLQPYKIVDVKSNVSGKVESLKVDLGDYVKTGQLLATIDPTDTQTQFEQAVANLSRDKAKKLQALQNLTLQEKQSVNEIAQAKQQLLTAQAKLREAENTYKTQPGLTNASIAEAQANYAAAEQSLKQLVTATIPQAKMQAHSNLAQCASNLDTAKKNLDRQKQLLDRGFVPASTVDTVQSEYQAAKSAYDTAKQKQDTVDQEYAAATDEAKARLAQAKAQMLSARRNAIQVQLKRDELEAARAAVDQAKSALNLAYANQRQIEVKKGDITTAEAAIVSSQAAYSQAKQNVTYLRITAPRDGVVVVKDVEQGTIVASAKAAVVQGSNILQLADISRMYVVCNVDETDIAGVEVNEKVDITVDAYPSEIFEGKVWRVEPQAKVVQNVTQIPVWVEVENPDRRLRPQMNAECEFITSEHKNVLAVPNEAVHEDNGNYTVMVVRGDKRISRPVEVGIAGAENTEIRSGLKAGETIVTQIIEPQKENSNAATNQQPRSPFSPFGGPPQRRGGGGGGGGGGGRGR